MVRGRWRGFWSICEGKGYVKLRGIRFPEVHLRFRGFEVIEVHLRLCEVKGYEKLRGM